MSLENVTAVIVSRLDHELDEVLAPLRAEPRIKTVVLVRGSEGPVERWRFIAAMCGPDDWWYTQDDDAAVNVAGVLDAADPAAIVCNVPATHQRDYPDGITLVGWGCVGLGFGLAAKALCRYGKLYGEFDKTADREADRIVTGLAPHKVIDVGRRNLPWADGPGRMCRAPEHAASTAEIRRRIYHVRRSA